MKVMLLAAGRGSRMQSLTDKQPKSLLHVGGKALIVHQLERLKNAGFTEIVINISYCAEQIKAALGDGRDVGVSIHYSFEETLLETGGGIFNALPLLGEQPFLVVNSDVWTDYPFAKLRAPIKNLAHLVMIDNPAQQHPTGDFYLQNNLLNQKEGLRLTYSGISVFDPQFFAACKPGAFALAPLLRSAMDKELVTGEHYQGVWIDVGTPERLALANEVASKK